MANTEAVLLIISTNAVTGLVTVSMDIQIFESPNHLYK